MFGSNGLVGEHAEFLIDGPGIVVGRKGSVGALAFSAEPFWPIDTTYYVVDKGDHNWRYLYYLLSSCGLTRLNSHSAVPGLNREDVYSIPVRMRLATFRTGSPGCSTACQTPSNLSVWRWLTPRSCSVPRLAAFTRGLRGEPTKETALGPLPESWSVADFADVREWLQYGTSVHCTLEERRYPVLRIPNIEPGRVNPAEMKYADLLENSAARYLLSQVTCSLSAPMACLSASAPARCTRRSWPERCSASYLIRSRLKPVVDPRYVAYFYGSPGGTALVPAGRRRR